IAIASPCPLTEKSYGLEQLWSKLFCDSPRGETSGDLSLILGLKPNRNGRINAADSIDDTINGAELAHGWKLLFCFLHAGKLHDDPTLGLCSKYSRRIVFT